MHGPLGGSTLLRPPTVFVSTGHRAFVMGAVLSPFPRSEFQSPSRNRVYKNEGLRVRVYQYQPGVYIGPRPSEAARTSKPKVPAN